jgi:hypothetical protein
MILKTMQRECINAVPWQQQLYECTTILCYMYIAFLVICISLTQQVHSGINTSDLCSWDMWFKSQPAHQMHLWTVSLHGDIAFEGAPCNDVGSYLLCIVLRVSQDKCALATSNIIWAVKPFIQVQHFFNFDTQEVTVMSLWLVSFTWHMDVLCVAPICTQYSLPLTVFTHAVGTPALQWRISIFVACCGHHSMSNIPPFISSLNLQSVTEFYCIFINCCDHTIFLILAFKDSVTSSHTAWNCCPLSNAPFCFV